MKTVQDFLSIIVACGRALIGPTPSVGDLWKWDAWDAQDVPIDLSPVRVVGVKNGFVAYESTKPKTLFREGTCSVSDFRFCYKKA